MRVLFGKGALRSARSTGAVSFRWWLA